jgi:ATP-dependent Lon protease
LLKTKGYSSFRFSCQPKRGPSKAGWFVSFFLKKGKMAQILRMIRMPDGNTTVIIQGKRRFKIKEYTQEVPYFKARVEATLETPPKKKKKEINALIDSVKEMATKIIELSPAIPTEASFALKNIDSPNFLINFIASNLNVGTAEKQELLQIDGLHEKGEKVLFHMNKEMQMLELKNQIQSKVKTDIDKQQRDYFLHQQMRAIQEELGHDSPDKELEEFRRKGEKKKWGKDIAKAFNKELDKLQRTNPAAPEYSVTLNYIELLLELPWNEYSKDNFDLKKAQKVLDKDHFGLEKVKDRILEYLAVLKLKGDLKSPILCLYGPPGVGKTSLGKSIARAVGRKYVRMSLGGLHDESELRGHRKTYIGAMPGRIIQSLKKANTANPVFVLDEVDKIGSDFRGDPSSALLEILDPEQNDTFHDNYVDLDFDLSKIMFIATANRLDTIQPALLDRMEIIELSGYTIEEKIQIANKHLIPKQRREHGLKAKDFKLSNKVLEQLIDEYTRESGVRGLEKKIATLIRNRAKEIVAETEFAASMPMEQVHEILGAQRMDKEVYGDNKQAGVVTGLAWTQVGGKIMLVESTMSKGKGKVQLTGQLGDVMKESASLALTYLKANAKDLEIDHRVFEMYDFHLHFPAGAVPKDGPSAGIAILTSLYSLVTQRKVKNRVAMTGEITLRGKVLPVGGIKEKILAAKRAGIKEIFLSQANEKDILDIPEHYRKNVTFTYVEDMDTLLKHTVTEQKVKDPKVWELE